MCPSINPRRARCNLTTGGAVREHCGYAALGWGGQHIYIFPTRDLLVVMTSKWTGAVNSGAQIGANEDILQMVWEAQIGF